MNVRKFLIILSLLPSLTACSKTKSPSETNSIYSTDSVQENWYKYEYDSKTDGYTIVGLILSSNMGAEIRIPLMHEGKKVLSLASGALKGWNKASSLVFPENFHSISSLDYGNLQEIVLPRVLSHLSFGSFSLSIGPSPKITWPERCQTMEYMNSLRLTEIHIPEGVEDFVAPYHSYHLTKLILPTTLRSLTIENESLNRNLYEVYNLSQSISDATIQSPFPSVKAIHHSLSDASNLTSQNGILFYQDETLTAPIGYDFSNDTTLKFPSKVNGKAYSIQSHAFENYNVFPKNIILPKELLSIDSKPFIDLDVDLNFFCEPEEQPAEWKIDFSLSNAVYYGGNYHPDAIHKLNVYWGSQWQLSDGEPVIL